VLSPTIAVPPKAGNVYETPSTFKTSEVVFEALSVTAPFRSNSYAALPELPASIEISNESSPVKLVLRSIWKP